jgi:PAS domain-containing protein
MRGVRAIRWKLFLLIVCAVSTPVAFVTVYFPINRVAILEKALTAKAITLSRLLVNETRSAIAFDDSQTAREVFSAISDDPDVLAVALFRADGTLLEATGTPPERSPAWTDAPLTSRSPRMVRIVTPVIASEGPRGLLVLDLSSAGALAEGASTRRKALLIGLVALLMGCAAAWLVGTSFGRRVNRIRGEAARVAGGDLSDAPVVDASSDEIGQLAHAFRAMVNKVHEAYANIERQVVERTEALRASHEQNRALLETTNAVPWEMDASGADLRFTYVGPQAATLFQTPVECWASGSTWTALLEPEDVAATKRAFEQAAADGKDHEAEFRIRRASGRPLWLRALITPVTTSARSPTSATSEPSRSVGRTSPAMVGCDKVPPTCRAMSM